MLAMADPRPGGDGFLRSSTLRESKRQRLFKSGSFHSSDATHHHIQSEMKLTAAAGSVDPLADSEGLQSVADWSDDDVPADALLCDTAAALKMLKDQFPRIPGVPPFVLQSQLYTALTDRTAADRELDHLRQSNTVRVFKLASGPDDHALMTSVDYEALVRNRIEGLKAKGAPSKDVEVMERFARVVLPRCVGMHVPKGELLTCLCGEEAEGQAPGHQNPPHESPSSLAKSTSFSTSSAKEANLAILLGQGLITRHPGGSEAFYFAVPGLGSVVRGIAAGRAELLSVLKKKRHGEAKERELRARTLRGSALGSAWHIADLVGSGLALRVETTVGPVIRVTRPR